MHLILLFIPQIAENRFLTYGSSVLLPYTHPDLKTSSQSAPNRLGFQNTDVAGLHHELLVNKRLHFLLDLDRGVLLIALESVK